MDDPLPFPPGRKTPLMNVTSDTQTTLSQPPACPSSYYDYVSIRNGMNGVTIRRRLLSLPLVTGRATPGHPLFVRRYVFTSQYHLSRLMALTLLELIVLHHLLNISLPASWIYQVLHPNKTWRILQKNYTDSLKKKTLTTIIFDYIMFNIKSNLPARDAKFNTYSRCFK